MNLLARFLEDDESAAEKIHALCKRQNELQDQLANAAKRLDELETEIAEATATGAADEVTDGREERAELRDQVADLTAALDVVKRKISELTPDLLRERLEDLASDYQRSYDRAASALERLEGKLPEALDEILRYQQHLRQSGDASREITSVIDRLREAGHEVARPVETAHTDKRLIDGRPLFVQYAVDRLPSHLIFNAYLDHVDQTEEG